LLARLSIIASTNRSELSNLQDSRLFARAGGHVPVIKLDIINRLADETGIPKLKAEQAVEALFNSMKDALSRGDRIELRGFGVFIVKPRKRGVGRNPRTGEEVAIPSGKTIRFKPGKELQDHGENGDAGDADDAGDAEV